ncbi:MAG: polymer-forming cytoskeletal protein [Acidobacteria bacterium]|nr:polymer-forming cytoskeletal protein [Acidobacteriota bacterium]
MWGKKRDEEPSPTRPSYNPPPPPANPAPAAKPVETRKETPVSSLPPARFEPDVRGGAATIGKAVKVVGQIFSKEDLFVDGEVEGTLEALEHKLTIGPHGGIRAGIKAREVAVLGTVQGNIEAADKIEIRKDAKVVGDIKTARIIIEDGAYFKGAIDIVKPEPAKVKPAAQVSAAPAQAAAAASPAPAGAQDNRR